MNGPVRPPDWMDRALCADADPEGFYPVSGPPSNHVLDLCRACPARAACLDYALTNHEAFGVWGGLGPEARQRLQRGKATA